MKSRSLRNYISRNTLPWLLVILLVISLLSIGVTRHVTEQELKRHHSSISLRFNEHLQGFIQSSNQQINNIARNDLVINGLIDIQEREKYIPTLFRSMRLAGMDEARLWLTDFSGLPIIEHSIPFPTDKSWLASVLQKGQFVSRLNADGLLIAAPVLYASYPEGAVVSHISLPALSESLEISLKYELVIYVSEDNQVLYSSDAAIAEIGTEFKALNSDDWYQFQTRFENGALLVSAERSEHVYARVSVFFGVLIFSIVASLLTTFLSIRIAGGLASDIFQRFLISIRGVKSSGSWNRLLPHQDEPKEVELLQVEFNHLLSDLAKSSLSVDRFNNIINSLTEHLVVFDLEGNVLLSNSSFMDFEHQLDTRSSDLFEQVLPEPADHQAFYSDIEYFEYEQEYTNEGETGSNVMMIHWGRSAYLSDNGEKIGFVLVGTDITRTKKMEHSLHLMSRAMDKADTSIIITDARQDDMPVVYMNQSFVRMTGYSEQEVLGNNCRFMEGPDTDKAALERINAALRSHDPISETLIHYKKDGSSFYNELSITPIKDNHGRLTHYLGILFDASDRIRAENYLINAKNKAEESARLKSEFLASMSHEIRTPINGVMGMLNLLKQETLTREQQHYLELASFSADSLLNLINDILDFSKIEAGKMDLELLDFDLRSQLGEFAESMALKAQEKGVELILDVTEVAHSWVVGDPGRVRQILHNLVGNGIKFTEQGGVLIRARTSVKDDKTLLFFCEVSDSGIGISSDKLDSLFDSFTQEDTSTTRKYGGTGLGLAIARQLCELMQGTIEVQSEVGAGSRFSFEVCVGVSSKAGYEMPQIDISGQRILVVDDNLTNREMLVKQLELWQAKATSTMGAKSAIKLLREEGAVYDIVLLDMCMEGIDGENLGKVIRADTHIPQPKMVMMTSMGERGDARRFAEAGFEAYFRKPVITRDLFDALKVLTDGGVAMTSADPLVTRHHLRSLHRTRTTVHHRILLVEDNHINQIVACEMLKKLGYRADVAANGVEALELLNDAPQGQPYNLVIMDCQMPEMDGYDTTRAIRQGKGSRAHTDVMVIAMTANAMKGDREKCLQAGMNDYLAKPINEAELQQKLDLCFSQPTTPAI